MNVGDDPRTPSAALDTVRRYHEGTKHDFGRFARSLGYLDWASQPRPFRAFAGAPEVPLFPGPEVPQLGYEPRSLSYGQLLGERARPAPPAAAAIGDVLRHALGLSAWKQFGQSRWSLRVNPSSGNLHPTETYIICGPIAGVSASPGVYHYAPDRHALELRCAFEAGAWDASTDGTDRLLVALTSIHWRESWKYGERGFRYCQHDLGHAIAALSIAAALAGWRATLLPSWSHAMIGRLTGVARDEDFVEAEAEEPGCVLSLAAPETPGPVADPARLVAAVERGRWTGRASQLSEDHVQWTFIDEIAQATAPQELAPRMSVRPEGRSQAYLTGSPIDARRLVLQRRSALAFDGQSTIEAGTFFGMLERVMPEEHAPWDALWWTPRIHLAIFVHRVRDLPPGLYLLARDSQRADALRDACGRDFLWEAAHDLLPFYCLARGDCRRLAQRLSCDQEIAADGFFSLGMLAEFDSSLHAYGAPFYRNLFWESGLVGQMLYLEAEAAGARATGIGCFYDDPVHEVLGLQGHAFQSLYHFTIGTPIEDRRLTTETGYTWETR